MQTKYLLSESGKSDINISLQKSRSNFQIYVLNSPLFSNLNEEF